MTEAATQTDNTATQQTTGILDLLSEEQRGNPDVVKSLSKFKGGVPDLAKSYVELQSAYSKKQDGMVRVPGPEAKPEEVAAFHRAIGVPETVEGYEIPQEIEQPDTARIQAFYDFAHKNGIPPKTAQAAVLFQVQQQTAAANAEAEAFKKAYPTKEAAEAAVGAGNQVLSRLEEIDSNLAAPLKKALGSHLLTTQVLAALGTLFAESHEMTEAEALDQIETLDGQIETLRKSKDYQDGKKAAKEKMKQLTKQQLQMQGRILQTA